MHNYNSEKNLALYESQLSVMLLEAHKRGYGRKLTTKWIEQLQGIFSDATKRNYSTYKEYLLKKKSSKQLDAINFKNLTNAGFAQLVYEQEPQDYVLCSCLKNNIKNPALLLDEPSFIHLQHFNKLFLEDVIKHMPHLKEPEIPLQLSLKHYSLLYNKIRRNDLFREDARGRIPITKPSQISSKHAGILPDGASLAPALKNYHKFPVNKAMFFYRPDKNSTLVQEIGNAEHPYISGPSGTICYLLANFSRVLTFDMPQLKVLLALYAAALIAEGHHALWEIAIICFTKETFKKNLGKLHNVFFDNSVNLMRLGNPRQDQLLLEKTGDGRKIEEYSPSNTLTN